MLRFLKSPRKIALLRLFLLDTPIGRIYSDETYLKRRYRLCMGKPLELAAPKTFQEKLQWLKLYDRRPEYSRLVDKYAVRRVVAEKIGAEHLVPLLGVWDDPEQIDFDALPERFVLKCTHNSGLGMYICRDKRKMDVQKVKKGLKKGLRQDYGQFRRERVYSGVKPRIIAEQFLEDGSGGLVDYKFFCFDGKADCVMVCLDRHLDDTKFYFFDRNWKLLPYNKRGISAPKDFTLPRPQCLQELFQTAETLSAGLPFVRLDLYACGEHVYFSEYTFYPATGMDPNLLEQTDAYFGTKLKLEEQHEDNRISNQS